MSEIIARLIKVKLALLFVALVIYLFVSPSEPRSAWLRAVSAKTLGAIANLAHRGRVALSDGAGEIESRGDSGDRGLVTHRPNTDNGQAVFPDDFRRELDDAVRQLDVVRITERWQAIKYGKVASGGGSNPRFRQIREAASLAALFRRDTWRVAGRVVPKDQLEEFLLAHANSQFEEH